VRDTGIGISEEKRATVFDPFTQADTSTRRQFGGTGLGLTIAKHLAQALGGDVNLKESIPGTGSVFMFEMQCDRCGALETAHSPPPSVATHDKRPDHELEGLKILLVEDSVDNQDLICNLLSREGASVDVADSGLTGVKKAMSQYYNVVLMDIQMPGLDGHEAVAHLRAQGYNRPIAALTAHALSSERLKSLREGFDDYLTKPIDRTRLIRSLKRLGFLGAS
jgi:CheY-like chemotaxis protein